MYYFIIALIIALCLAFLIVHQQLARRLHLVETAFTQLEDALRTRLDLIVEWVNSLPEPDGNQTLLKELSDTARDGETEELMKSWVKIDKMLAEPEWEPLIENEQKIRELGAVYNNELEPYNAMLDRFPWRLYASSLMINKEERFRFHE